MQNASQEPVYYDPELGPIHNFPGLYLDERPDNVHDYLYGEAQVPLAQELSPFDHPPPGQVLLVRQLPAPDDPFWAEVQERNTTWLRLQSQDLLLAGDWRTRLEQEFQFASYTCKLLWQRGFEAFYPDRAWRSRFDKREVIEAAERLYERHNDVRLRIDLATEEFDLCGPNTRPRRCSDDVNVSLRPVVEALCLHGLWVGRQDERFHDLARVMVRLAAAERRELGCDEFHRRYGSGR